MVHLHIIQMKGGVSMAITSYGRVECRAALGAMSAAIRAERALQENGIFAQVVALEPGETRHGCAYGIAFPCADEACVRATLRAARIPISQYLKKG